MKIVILSILLFFSITIWSQMPEVQWKKCYGGTQIDYGKALAIDAEGYIYLCGSTSSSDINFENNNGSYDCAVIKISPNGDIIWSKTFGGSNLDRLNDILVTSEGDIIVAGYTSSNDFDISGNHGNSDVLAARLTPSGEILWVKCYGGADSEQAFSLIELNDGSIVIAAQSGSSDGDLDGNYGGDDIWIFGINLESELLWQNNYGGSLWEDVEEIKLGSDSTLIIVGGSESSNHDLENNNGFTDVFILEINLIGEVLNAFSYGSNKTDMGYGVIEAKDKSLIFGGRCGANNFDVSGYHGGVSDYWVGKIDSLGEIMWQLPLGGGGTDYGYTLEMQLDSNILIAGESTSNNGNVSLHYGTTSTTDLWFVILDKFGNFLIDTSFGGTENDAAYDILIVDSLNYFLFGHTASSDFDVSGFLGIQDMWLIKIGPSCNTNYFADIDGDGFGDISSDTLACELPIGYVLDSTDCNDLNPEINPTLTDICNAIDDNCNGLTDEDATFVTYFADLDGDTFGDVLNDTTACNELIGYVLDNTDCNDLNPEIHPTLTDICNAIDDNCNGLTDEDATFVTYFADIDGDTFGDVLNDSTACNELIGYVLDNSDCNDSNNAIYPDATELCNYLDDDCDGITDDNVTFIQSFIDADNDNFGNPDFDSIACEIPPGYVLSSTDCSDNNPDIYPGAPELLNGLDDDCDQIADEGLVTTDIVKNTISIFPNPVNNILFIQTDAIHKITIVNQLGEEILNTNLFIGLNTISVADFASGVYWVKAEDGEMVVWVKE